MLDSVRTELRGTLEEIRAAGLHKPERVIGTPQSATVAVTNVAPIEAYDWVLMRTTDPSQAGGWEGWVSGGNWAPLATHGFKAFSPRIGGVTVNAAPAQMIDRGTGYDRMISRTP